MSVKVKLTSLITTFILLCSLLAVGVFAVKNTTFNVGGNIEFNVKGIEADINLIDPGTANLAVNNESPVMQPIQIRNTTTESEIVSAFSTWSNLDLAFSPNKSTATIELEISNKSTDTNNYIGISASADALTKNNAEIIVTNNEGGQTALIGKDQTATFTITFKVVDDGYSAKLDNFVVKFDMKKLDTAELPQEGEVNSSITPSNDELTITKEDTTTKATQTLTETVSSTSQTTTYTYDIKNNSYTESIYLNPTATLSEEQTDVATTIYYSVEDNEISTLSSQSTEYKLLTEDYLVILPQKSVKVQVQMLPINVTSTKEVSLGVELNLHAEKPADFVQDYTYEIIDGEVYRTPICNTCECYQSPEKMNADEYIIATPETAQSILDSNINGKTIVFAEGLYKDLYLRPSVATATVYGWVDSDKHDGVQINTNSLSSTGKYHYERSINNVTFVGSENADFQGKIYSYSFIQTSKDEIVYDAVRNIDVNYVTGNYYTIHNKLDGLIFQDMNFSTVYGRIELATHVTDGTLYNITIKNCQFKGDKPGTTADTVSSYPAIVIEEGYGTANNILIKNNIISKYFQGIYVADVHNSNIINNTISETYHNAIAIQSFAGEGFTGEVNVKNNTISNGTDRAIKFNVGTNATVKVENNTITNANDEDGEVLQVKSLTNSSFVLVNNVLNGNPMEQLIAKSLTEFVVTTA